IRSRISTGAVRWFVPTRINRRSESMHASKVAGSQEGKQDGDKSDDVQYRGALPAPARCQAVVNEKKVDKPGDKSRDFFRVPSPVAAPDPFGPDGARYYPQRHGDHSNDQGRQQEAIQLLQRGEPL